MAGAVSPSGALGRCGPRDRPWVRGRWSA